MALRCNILANHIKLWNVCVLKFIVLIYVDYRGSKLILERGEKLVGCSSPERNDVAAFFFSWHVTERN